MYQRPLTRPFPDNTSGSRRAFTLIELLVVIAIIGILVGITLPAVQMVREAARRTQCSNHVKQIGTALANYESTRRRLPPGITSSTAKPYAYMTWLTQILPYIEQQNVWDQATVDYGIDPLPHVTHLGMRTPIPVYGCPSDPAAGNIHWTHNYRLVTSTNYLGVNGTNYTTRDGVFYQNSQTRMRDVTDGLSNTIFVGERPPSPDFWYGWWYAGYGQSGSGSPDMLLGVREINDSASYLESCPPGPYHFVRGKPTEMCDTLHFWSYHPGGGHFLFGDGSIKFLSYQANDVLPALATRAGGEGIGSFD